MRREAVIVERDDYYLLSPKFFQTKVISPVLRVQNLWFSTSTNEHLSRVKDASQTGAAMMDNNMKIP